MLYKERQIKLKEEYSKLAVKDCTFKPKLCKPKPKQNTDTKREKL